jgi:hypothetical protein
MKVTKTSVHRLTVAKTCGCSATREYEDARYAKPIGEGAFTPCEKHEKNKAVAEFAGEMLLEALDKEAESAGKTPTVTRESVPTALSGTTGEQVTSMGAPTVPKIRDKRDPLAPRTASFDRPDMRHPQNTQYGNLNIAQHDDVSDEEMAGAGITMSGSIDEVAEDPNATAVIQRDLEQIEGLLDEDDIKSSGVSQKLINAQAVD